MNISTKLTTFLVSFILITMQNFAQEAVIVVTGHGSIHTSPDNVRISTYVQAIDQSYENSINQLMSKTKELSLLLQKEGFKSEDIKTLSFNVSPNYVYENNKNQQRGFRASQSIEVEMDYNVERLTKIVRRLSESAVESTVNVSFYLSEEKRSTQKTELLKRAMLDAQNIATVLAQTQNKQLDGFKEIKYGVNEHNPSPYLRSNAMMDKSGEEFAGFHAKEIELSESVMVVWRVK